MQRQREVEESVALDDFLIADQALATTGIHTLEKIAVSCRSNSQPAEPDSEESDDEAVTVEVQPVETITRQIAYKGFDQMHRYIEENTKDRELIHMYHELEDFFYQEQTSITKFMPSREPVRD